MGIHISKETNLRRPGKRSSCSEVRVMVESDERPPTRELMTKPTSFPAYRSGQMM
jgi:hypothetical protein